MPSALSIDLDPTTTSTTATLHLRGEASYREAAELRQALFDAIETSLDKNLVVALDEVDRIDTAAMAVLLEGLVATHGRGPDVFLVGAGESVRRVFELAGYEEALVRCYGCWGDFEQAVSG